MAKFVLTIEDKENGRTMVDWTLPTEPYDQVATTTSELLASEIKEWITETLLPRYQMKQTEFKGEQYRDN